MALEHAILVSLSEKPGSGYELTRRFDRSIGYFWTATHQQIYRVLATMVASGWVTVKTIEQKSRPDKRLYRVTSKGRSELDRWVKAPCAVDPVRSDIAVKIRGSSPLDREPLLEEVRSHLETHLAVLHEYQELAHSDFREPDELSGVQLQQYLVLRGGLLTEQAQVIWLNEVLETLNEAKDPSFEEEFGNA